MKTQELLQEHQALLIGRWMTDLANTSAFLFMHLPNLNWAGFYLLYGDTLFLGPFQGKPACTEIPMGKGVCGTAALKRETLIVPNVHEFPGHISCDAASQSEIVIPLISHGQLLGVLDLDSPQLARFHKNDETFLNEVVVQLLTSMQAHNDFDGSLMSHLSKHSFK